MLAIRLKHASCMYSSSNLKKLKAKNHEYPSDCWRSVQSSLAASHPLGSSHMVESPSAHSITTDSHAAHMKYPPARRKSGLSQVAKTACFFKGGSLGCSGSMAGLKGVGKDACMMQLNNLAWARFSYKARFVYISL